MAKPLRVCLASMMISASSLLAEGFTPTFAGQGGVLPSLGMGANQPVLVDPKRITMRQSVTFSAMSGGGSTMSQSLYQNRMDWKLSDPLTLHLDLGLMTPLSTSGPIAQVYKPGAYLIPSVGLEYRPSESVMMILQYTGYPSAPVGSKGGLPWQ